MLLKFRQIITKGSSKNVRKIDRAKVGERWVSQSSVNEEQLREGGASVAEIAIGDK